MYKGKIGFRVFNGPEFPPRDLLDSFSGIPTSNIADAMCGFHAMDAGFKAVCQDKTVIGPALTVMARPGDNLMLHKALHVARPGEIMVVQTGGAHNNAVWGELMTGVALKVGLAGLIVDGAVRDVHAIRETGFPVFARSFVSQACDKEGPGEINVPIACGGIAVLPGDIVVADSEGIVVIPRQDVESVLNATLKVKDNEVQRTKEIRADNLFPKSMLRLFNEKGLG